MSELKNHQVNVTFVMSLCSLMKLREKLHLALFHRILFLKRNFEVVSGFERGRLPNDIIVDVILKMFSCQAVYFEMVGYNFWETAVKFRVVQAERIHSLLAVSLIFQSYVV